MKQTCKVCLLLGTGVSLASLRACTASKNAVKYVAQEGKIILPLSVFEQKEMEIVNTNAWDYEIAVRKHEDGTYSAISMVCTHHEEALVPTPEGFVCDAHGSLFSKTGKVLKAPAKRDLTHLKVETLDNQLIVYLKKV